MAIHAPLLTTLPTEILLDISEHLRASALVRLSRTCQTLRHLGGGKHVAKAFMRRKSADDAIIYLQKVNVNCMGLVVELFRHAKDRKLAYANAAMIAARLNDLTQLRAWQAEFGEIPSRAILGAAQSDRIETFEFLMPHVQLRNRMTKSLFATIGVEGNRALLDHLRTNYPDMTTPRRLEAVVENSALDGKLDFALKVFEGMSPRCGQVIHDCAGHIAEGAAEYGDMDLFTEFINMFQYGAGRRNEIAESAARHNRVDFMRLQEESMNFADSFGDALVTAVAENYLEIVQFILEDDDIVENRLDCRELVDSFQSAMELKRSEMLPLLLARAPRVSLLHDAANSESLEDAKMLLSAMSLDQILRGDDVDGEIEFDAYTKDVPDWKMTVWLVIIGLDADAQWEKSNIGDDERARYLSVLPAAIDLAKELKLDQEITIDDMRQFADGTLEYSSDYY